MCSKSLKNAAGCWAGKGSGHLLALDKHTTGDGLISALQVLQACVRSGKTLAQLLADVVLFPQTLINVRSRGKPGQDWKSRPRRWRVPDEAAAARVVEARDGSQELGRHRPAADAAPSGTEPTAAAVMVEARDAPAGQGLRCVREYGSEARVQRQRPEHRCFLFLGFL